MVDSEGILIKRNLLSEVLVPLVPSLATTRLTNRWRYGVTVKCKVAAIKDGIYDKWQKFIRCHVHWKFCAVQYKRTYKRVKQKPSRKTRKLYLKSLFKRLSYKFWLENTNGGTKFESKTKSVPDERTIATATARSPTEGEVRVYQMTRGTGAQLILQPLPLRRSMKTNKQGPFR